MKSTQNRVRNNLLAFVSALTLGLVFALPAAPARADDGAGDGDSIIDIILDWIDDFFDPDAPEEVLPSEGEGW